MDGGEGHRVSPPLVVVNRSKGTSKTLGPEAPYSCKVPPGPLLAGATLCNVKKKCLKGLPGMQNEQGRRGGVDLEPGGNKWIPGTTFEDECTS